MAEGNLYCDESGCPNPSFVFGFLSNGLKTKVCQAHVTVLSSKQGIMFNISAFNFIEEIKDGVLYNDRQKLMQKGIATVTTLESRCEEEWRDAQIRLQDSYNSLFEVMQKTYECMWTKGKQCYDLTKRRLQETRVELNRLVEEKYYQPSPQVVDVCEKGPAGAPIRIIVGDCRVQEVETVLSHFHCLSTEDSTDEKLADLRRKEEELGSMDVVWELNKYAKEQGYSHTNTQQTLFQFKENIDFKVKTLLYTDQEIHETAGKCLNEGLLHVTKGEYDTAVKELEKGRNLLRIRGMEDTELWVRISNTTAETHRQEWKYSECEKVCKEVLSTYERHGNTFEMYRALFFLTDSLYSQFKYSEGSSLLTCWKDKLSPPSPPTQCFHFYLQARDFQMRNDPLNAAEKYKKGLALSHLLPSDAYITAFARISLGFLYEMIVKDGKKAEEEYRKGLETYFLICPFSMSTSWCLNHLGEILYRNEEYDSSEEILTQAYRISACKSSVNSVLGYTFYLLGLLFKATDRLDEAVESLQQALPILEECRPDLAGRCSEEIEYIVGSKN